MINHQTDRRSRARKIIAAAVVSLLVLRGLSVLGIAGAFVGLSSLASPVPLAFILEERCDRAEDKADHKNPRQDRSDCCVLCASAIRDLAVTAVSSF